jgi:glycosyltransferase involved in cell wall biosynthesis
MPLTSATIPTVSAVIPTYNDAARIVDALASAANQTLPPIEIIVSDDASTDDTREVVERFASGCTVPVRYTRHDTRAGVVATRNEGISAAAGDWIANCDSDDYWHPSKLETQVAFVRAWSGSAIAVVGTHGCNVNDARRVVSPATLGPLTEPEYETLRLGGIYFMLHSSIVFARSDYLAVGGYTNEYWPVDDVHFVGRLARMGVVIAVPESLTFYRKRAGSIQHSQFWGHRYQLDRLDANEQRRAQGEPPLTIDEFHRMRRSAPPRERLTYWLYGRAKYHYRCGAVEFVNDRKARGGLHIVLATLLARDLTHMRRAARAISYRLRRQ